MRVQRVQPVAFLLLAVVSGCGSVSDDALNASLRAVQSETTVDARTPQAPAQQRGASRRSAGTSCGDLYASWRPRGPLPPPRRMPAATFMRKIQQRGKLIAGVDMNTLRFGYRDPITQRIRGFDIDMLREVARAIFGNAKDKIAFRPISSAERADVVERKDVDIVADLMSITCERRKQVDFTTVYFEAKQRILVPANSPVRSIRDLDGERVCATRTSTSIDVLRRNWPLVKPYDVPLRTDCLLALQEGTVAAISTDDAILVGFQVQDRYTRIVGGSLNKEHWGMAIHKDHREFVRFVNAVLERVRQRKWKAIYERHLDRVAPDPPAPRYRD